jgi:hypothetical protein
MLLGPEPAAPPLLAGLSFVARSAYVARMTTAQDAPAGTQDTPWSVEELWEETQAGHARPLWGLFEVQPEARGRAAAYGVQLAAVDVTGLELPAAVAACQAAARAAHPTLQQVAVSAAFVTGHGVGRTRRAWLRLPAAAAPAAQAETHPAAPAPPRPAADPARDLAAELAELRALVGQAVSGRAMVQSDPLAGAVSIATMLQQATAAARSEVMEIMRAKPGGSGGDALPVNADLFRQLGELSAKVAAPAAGEGMTGALIRGAFEALGPHVGQLAQAVTTFAEARQLEAAAKAKAAGVPLEPTAPQSATVSEVKA